jgi:hypothetical protein
LGEHKIKDQKKLGVGLDELDIVLETVIRATIQSFLLAGDEGEFTDAQLSNSIVKTMRKLEECLFSMHRPAFKAAYGRVMQEMQENLQKAVVESEGSEKI